MKVAIRALADYVRKVLATLPQKTEGATLLALSGDLGAGKTTFVQALARELGIADAVQSPTYVLMKSYSLPIRQGETLYNKVSPWKKLVHIDLYRLEKPEELAALKLREVFANPRALICIEWPERAEGELPQPDVTLTFSSDGVKEGERNIEIEQ